MNIAIFASGTGSNARKILEYFQPHPKIRVRLVASNRKAAPVLEIGKSFGVETFIISKPMLADLQDIRGVSALTDKLTELSIDYIVLAGFLVLMPVGLVHRYEGHILNIHPALLPQFGGKGMYGMKVHEAVHAAHATESGMTVHLVNEFYDQGEILFQARVALHTDDTPSDIARKVLQLEHRYYPPVIEEYALRKQGFGRGT